MTHTRCHRAGVCRVLYSTHERVVMDIYFVHQDGLIFLKAPFNREANQDYKKIGGRWSPDRKMWSFESQDLNRVRKVLVEHFGYDDRVVDTVDARVVLYGALSEVGGC